MRALKAVDPELAHEFVEVFKEFYRHRNKQRVITFTESMLWLFARQRYLTNRHHVSLLWRFVIIITISLHIAVRSTEGEYRLLYDPLMEQSLEPFGFKRLKKTCANPNRMNTTLATQTNA
ncbi:hypothetical protein [Laceyella putida]|uniref:Uncharacterized protein n=1 Tax=Laceyella putida TaxID=110101 RepID=A0ABW2RL25_9BACL